MNNPLESLIKDTLKKIFGFDDFLKGQAEVIENLLDGKSVLAVFPTGAGKSLCYQLPALCLDGLTLVVSPLIALMKDQIDFLQSKHINAARLDSSLTGREARAVWNDLYAGRLKLLYIAPERFSNERFAKRLRRISIDMMVIDEAHCISEWGHNFRPHYLKLGQIARDLSIGRILALTATATPAVAADICKEFSVTSDAYINTGFYRPNLSLRITPCSEVNRNGYLLEFLRKHPPGPTIIYATLQRTSENVAQLLRENGFDARAYHAGMKSEARHEVQEWFMKSDNGIVVATIAFGMGIDKADIRYVYHYNMSKSPENYAQETGRAGRDGQNAICEMLVCDEDVITLENFLYGDTPTFDSVHSIICNVLSLGDAFDVSFYELSFLHDIRPIVISTLMCYLELERIIESTGPFYTTYKFQPLKTSTEILTKFDKERVQFLKALFSRAVKGRTWFSIDLNGAVEAIGEPRERLVAALSYLEERGDILLNVQGARQGYRILNLPVDFEALAQKLTERFLEAERRNCARIEIVRGLAEYNGCITRRVLEYFGEDLGGDCGYCGRCIGESRLDSQQAYKKALREKILGDREKTIVQSIRDQNHEALRTPRQLARFLCGISSPAASRTRPSLGKHELFGVFSAVPFGNVLEFVSE